MGIEIRPVEVSQTNKKVRVETKAQNPNFGAVSEPEAQDNTVRNTVLIGGAVLAAAVGAYFMFRKGKGTDAVNKAKDAVNKTGEAVADNGKKTADAGKKAGESIADGTKPIAQKSTNSNTPPVSTVPTEQIEVLKETRLKELTKTTLAKEEIDNMPKFIDALGHDSDRWENDIVVGRAKELLYRQHGIKADSGYSKMLHTEGYIKKTECFIEGDEDLFKLAETYSQIIGRPLNIAEAKTLSASWHMHEGTKDQYAELFKQLKELANDRGKHILSIDGKLEKDIMSHADFIFNCFQDSNKFAKNDISGLVFDMRQYFA